MKITTLLMNQFNNTIFFCEILLIFCLMLALTLIYLSFDDYEQFIYWKIIYIHVPLASLSLIIYLIKVFCSIIYLIWHLAFMSILAQQLAPIAFTFQVLCLITGSLWGKVSWGTYWEFDSRLTSMLIITLITLIYVIINKVLTNSTEIKTWQRKDRLLSIVSILGGLIIPIIKYSVDWWSNLHQKSSINILNNGVDFLDSSVYLPLLLMFISFSLISIILVINNVISFSTQRKKDILQNF